MTEIVLPDELKRIEPSTFEDCWKLKKVVFPTKLESIGKYAFYACYNLKDIKLTSSVKKIGHSAFKILYTAYGRIGNDSRGVYFAASASLAREEGWLLDIRFGAGSSLQKKGWSGEEYKNVNKAMLDKLLAAKKKTFYCPKDSFIERYAQENEFRVINFTEEEEEYKN